MPKSEDAILAKLDRPPAAPNWALSNFKELRRTRSALVNLALGFPQISYQWAHRTIQLTICDRRTDEQAIALLRHICPAIQWDHNLGLLHAFLQYNAARRFDGIPTYPEYEGYFLAGPDVRVPVRPTAIIREDGMLKPIFVVGWARNKLGLYQRRLLASILEDAIYSLTDFMEAPGEVLFFPANGYGIRQVDRWHRHTYPLLSRDELAEQVARFITARNEARLLIPVRLKERDARHEELKRARLRPDPKRPPA